MKLSRSLPPPFSVMVAAEKFNLSGHPLRDCLIITSPIFREDTNWVDLEMKIFHSISLYWFDNHGSHEKVTSTATMMFLFVGDSPKRRFDLKNPLAMKDFCENVSEVVISLGARESYRNLIALSSPSKAKKLLLKANDVAACFAFKPGNKAYAAARQNDFFFRLFKNEEEKFALISLESVLAELENNSRVAVGKLSVDVPIGTDMDIEVTFDFENSLEQQTPINVVIGPNGSGKTRMLLGIAQRSLDKSLNIYYPASEKSKSNLTQFRTIEIAAYTFEQQHWNSLRRRGVKVSPLGISNLNWKLNSGMIQKIAIASLSNGFDLKALSEVLKQVIDVSELYIPLLPNSGYGFPIGRNEYIGFDSLVDNFDKERVSLINSKRPPVMFSEEKGEYYLSSGQKTLFCFCTSFFMNTNPGSLLLIDEPENHLHPQFVTLLMQTLSSSLIAKESKAIIVTHSPFVVREVDKNAVLVLGVNNDNLPAIYKPSLQTLGADVSVIADYVFQDMGVKKGYEKKIDELFKLSDFSEQEFNIESLSDHFGSDAMSYARKEFGRNS